MDRFEASIKRSHCASICHDDDGSAARNEFHQLLPDVCDCKLLFCSRSSCKVADPRVTIQTHGRTWVFYHSKPHTLRVRGFVRMNFGFSHIHIYDCRPPWILSTIVCSINAWHAGNTIVIIPPFTVYCTHLLLDRTGERYFHMAGLWWAVIIGYIISLSTHAVGGRYVTLFLMASGYSSKPLNHSLALSAHIADPKVLRSLWCGYQMLFHGRRQNVLSVWVL